MSFIKDKIYDVVKDDCDPDGTGKIALHRLMPDPEDMFIIAILAILYIIGSISMLFGINQTVIGFIHLIFVLYWIGMTSFIILATFMIVGEYVKEKVEEWFTELFSREIEFK